MLFFLEKQSVPPSSDFIAQAACGPARVSACNASLLHHGRRAVTVVLASQSYINIYDRFYFYLSSSFFFSALVWDAQNWNSPAKPLRSSAVFGGRLKRPSPCRIRSTRGRDRVRGLSETSERCANICIWGGIRPSCNGSWHMQSLNEKHILGMGKHLFPSWHHFRIGFLFRHHRTFFHFHVSKRLAYCAHLTTAVPLPFDIGFQC